MENNNIKPLLGKTPKIGNNCFIAETSTIIGDVTIGNNCSIWYGAILRGDVGAIQIGDDSNIQDGAIIHSTYDISTVVIGKRVSIAHGAIIHGCTIENDVLVGMGAIVMDNAILKTKSMIAAGAVVPANMVCESGWIYAGIPAKKIKKLDLSKMADFFARTPENYKKYSKWYLDEGYGKL
ncbi:MAG TPA: gamma carbonic anhydrase family protein [Bacteroidetes bacterium]|nr:gamma carbonic anhydrase family protein [Bacteroidota bacterium]